MIRLHGLNPTTMKSYDAVRSIDEHANSRVEQICLAWPWPEWTVTEERAYRQVYRDDIQYFRTNSSGVPDEVYFLPNATYYRINPDATIDPPVGTSPTDPSTQSFWVQLTQVDPYIEYDQPYKRSIGEILGVYSVDPRTVGCCAGPWMLKYHPSEKGIDVCGGSSTVFILYQMPVPTYSMRPWIGGVPNNAGDVVISTVTSECYQAITYVLDSPENSPQSWVRVPFLSKWFDFVRWGAFADSLGEIDQGNSIDPNIRAASAANAENQAMQSLQAAIDSLTMQGQKLQWNFNRQRYWCESCPWTGGQVTTLTDAKENDKGFVFPTPGTQPGPTDEYHPEIKSIDGDTPSLVSAPTILRSINSLIKIVITEAPSVSNIPEQQVWILTAGTAQVGNPGEKNPLDYNPLNPKFWRRMQ